MGDTPRIDESLVTLFTDVLGCNRCPRSLVKRDGAYNIPQPGWVGRNYGGLMFVGQNPGEGSAPPTDPDRQYLEALGLVCDSPSLDEMHDRLKEATDSFTYYSSFRFDVDIERVAYINAVRCRTKENSAPVREIQQNCRHHFLEWVKRLRPRGVVYLGLFAQRATADLLDRLRIEYVVISRQRSLSTQKRAEQDKNARQFILKVLSGE